MGKRLSLRLKNIFYNFLAFSSGFIFILIVLEIVLRFFPVTDVYFLDRVNEKNYALRFLQKKTWITYSLGWNFYHVSHKWLNGEGFFNNLEYPKNPDKPVIAVIGDSYVEAL